MSTEWKVVNTSYFMYFAVLASDDSRPDDSGRDGSRAAAEGLYAGECSSGCARRRGAIQSFAGVFISILGFGFLGGISGVMMGTEQLNMIIHNTIYVPGPFPRHRSRRHDADVHGADVLPHSRCCSSGR